MSLLQDAIKITEKIEGLNGLADGLQKLSDAETGLEAAAAASQIVAELALAAAVTATVRTSMSAVRLGLAVSGKIWKWDAISYAAGAASGITAGKIIDAVNDMNLGSKLYDALHPDDRVRSNYADAKNQPRRDPLAIDLDGDGIETVGVGAGVLPILFDHNSDGIKTGTGWLKADDAWLVLDRNANGAIDSGLELFGVDTQITKENGVQRAAFSGFEALGALDSNNDKIFDARDDAFTQVRLWQDLNQDGISQSDEISTLQQKNITSISLVSTTGATDLGNGNVVTGMAAVTFSNNVVAHIDSVSLAGTKANNLDLADNPFYREFSDQIPLTSVARVLPEMGGSGWVRDLREAMSQDTANAHALATTVAAFAQATTRTAQLNLIDDLLAKWASSSGKHDSTPDLVEGITETLVSESGNTKTYRVTAMDPAQLQALLSNNSNAAYDAAKLVIDDEAYTHRPEGSQTIQLTEAGVEVMRRLAVIEVFNGRRFLDFTRIQNIQPSGGGGSGGGGGGGGGIVIVVPPVGPQVRYEIQIAAEQIASLNLAYDALKESVYVGLLMQTRLMPYIGSIRLANVAGSVDFDVNPLVQLLVNRKSADAASALTDLIELNRYSYATLNAVGLDSVLLLRTWISEFSNEPWLASTLADLNVSLGTSGEMSSGADLYLGLDGRDTVNSGDGNDLIDAGASADQVNAGRGDDTLLGGAGSDTLYGEDGADWLTGGANNDQLNGGAGSDVLDGGTGNDYMSGGNGEDIYRFGRGYGQDTIANYDSRAPGTKGDELQLGEGITASDIKLDRFGDALIISLIGTNDQVEVQGYFDQDGESSNTVNIRFLDGTQLSVEQIKALVLTPGQHTGVIQIGYGTADLLIGGDGRDQLSGEGGNDTLYGADGRDQLSGDDGDDKLLGGSGNDGLYGGDGHDLLQGDRRLETVVISAKASLAGGIGAEMQLWINGEKVGATEVRATSGWADYAFDVNLPQGAEMSLDVVFANDIYVNGEDRNLLINTVSLGGHVMSPTDSGVKLDLGSGAASFDGIDVLTGSSGLYQNAALRFTVPVSVVGGGGNDYLYGQAGNDTLDGGVGNDSLSGGDGADVYLFGRGDGQDSISNYDADALGVNADAIQLGAGITTADVILTRSSDDLLISIKGTDDRVLVQNYFYLNGNSRYALESIKFIDNTVWDYAAVTSNLSTTPAPAAVTLYGTDISEILTGGEGNDVLVGDAGDDTLQGGGGDDYLIGDAGNDTYLFGKGAGKDIIHNRDTGAGKTDVVRLGAGISTSDVVLTKVNDDLLLSLRGSADSLRIRGYFYEDVTDGGQVEQIIFADGTSWDVGFVKSKVNFATVGADALSGYSTADSLAGLAGDDSIYGGAGNDTLDGGSGEDTLYGDYGDDLLLGGAQNDALYGDLGNDSLLGQDGRDYLLGGTGNDTLDGGAGNDTLIGDSGNDTFVFRRGSGKDTITGYDSSPDKRDVVQLGVGITASDVLLERSSDTLLISIEGTSDSLEIINYFQNDATYGHQVEEIQFADGTIWDVSAVKSKVIVATADGDYLTGYETADWLTGLAGDDSLDGRGGNDTLDGGAGEDHLFGGEGDDQIKGGAQNDTLRGNAGDDHLEGQDGDDYLEGDNGNDILDGGFGVDLLSGSAGNDTLDGGLGVDFLRGGAGDDIYGVDETFDENGISLGFDVVTELSNEGTDTIALSSGQYYEMPDNVENLVMGPKAQSATGNALSNSITGSHLANQLLGLDGNDVLIGLEGNDSLDGGVGDDSLDGGAGKDTLDGGLGIDVLVGGAGDDSYYVDETFDEEGFIAIGMDTVTEAVDGGVDTVHSSVLQYVLPENVENLVMSGKNGTGNALDNQIIGSVDANTILGLDGNDVIIGMEGSDSISGGNGNDSLDGGHGDDTLFGNDGDDVMFSGIGADRLSGGAGADIMFGGDGDNILSGGTGDDYLSSGVGNDTFSWGRDQGADVLDDAGGTDLLNVLAGVTADQVWLRQVAGTNNLEISLVGTSDAFTVVNWYASASNQVESIKLSDGKALNTTGVQNLVNAMASFTPPAAGQTTLPANYQASLNAAIAANWV